ncbi:MAG TPA: tail fiber domain-containing protein [Phycisphaerales bacterium]|nr:tail fiber domain-containing protein [Phycisphaerales bacterium]
MRCLFSSFGRSTVRSLAVCAVAAAASVACGQTYTSQSGLTIPDFGAASPYPSVVVVNGGPQSITGITITLNDLIHTFPADLLVCLVAPDNTAITLLSSNGGGVDANSIDLTFAVNGVTPSSSPLGSIPYRPAGGAGLSIPNVTYVSSLVNFQGINANGVWQLYVFDNFGGDWGSLRNWSITFTDAPLSIAQATIPYQGRLDGGPLDGAIDVRYSVWNDPTSQSATAQVNRTRLQLGIPIAGGVFATNLTLDNPLSASAASYLQLEVANPAGTPFVAVGPRQLIRPAPLASRALSAATADTANIATTAQNAVLAETAAVANAVPWSGLTGQAGVTSASVGTGWQFRLVNNLAPAGFRGGIRQSDLGFLEITNVADVASPTFARLSSNGAWTAVSDARLKSDVTPAAGNLAVALALRPVSFRWNSTGLYDFGLIAQDVKAVMPGLVTGDEDKQMLTVNYSQLSVVAIGAIQELKARNDALEARVEKLEAMLEARSEK